MARTQPHTTRYPIPLWWAIRVEAAKRGTKPDHLIRATMDAEVRKTQGDYEQWFVCTQSTTKDGPREGFLDRVSEMAVSTIAVTVGYGIEHIHALLTPRGPRGPRY